MAGIKSLRNSWVTACLFSLLLADGAVGTPSGILTDVQPAKDGKRIIVRHEGEIGKHAAFVIEQPHRLVIDFSGTSLGKAPRKINVNGNGIREIRLGQTPSRARVVMDFGSNPVPAFRIKRMDGAVLVTLGDSVNPQSAQDPEGPAVGPRKAAALEERESADGPPRGPKSSLSVKQAGVEDQLVYVELVDKNLSGKTYRLVVDCSLRDLLVRHASLSDDAGTLKRFETVRSSAKKGASQEDPGAGRAVKRSGGGDKGEARAKFPWGKPVVRAKFHWGRPMVRVRKPEDDKVRGPFKLEDLKLKVRKQDT